MLSYIIEGGNKLEGQVKVSGSKNAALPIIGASILNRDVVELYNVPKIEDVHIMIDILERLGCTIERKENKLIIDSTNAIGYEIPENLMRKMRSSVMLVGAIIGRNKKAVFSQPGGCAIGKRPIDLHLRSLRELGVDVKEDNENIYCKTDKIIGKEIVLDFPSVGATENIILTSVYCEGETIIKNAAKEPEIEDLQNFLNSMGAKIEGAGSNIIRIEGVKKLNKASYHIMPDRIEAGTLLCMGACVGKEIEVTNCNHLHIQAILNKIKETGCKLSVNKDIIKLERINKLKAIKIIETMPYPDFPTDMQSIFTAMLSVAEGNSIMIENIFENRYRYINDLNRMGADILVEGKRAIIKGVEKLYGQRVSATDLRGGAALILAGLYAEGTTYIDNAHYICRGYENIEVKLKKLGAKISLI